MCISERTALQEQSPGSEEQHLEPCRAQTTQISVTWSPEGIAASMANSKIYELGAE